MDESIEQTDRRVVLGEERAAVPNGKVERCNRSRLEAGTYQRLWMSEQTRAKALVPFLHRYNQHRYHTAIKGSPIDRVTNVGRYYTDSLLRRPSIHSARGGTLPRRP